MRDRIRHGLPVGLNAAFVGWAGGVIAWLILGAAECVAQGYLSLAWSRVAAATLARYVEGGMLIGVIAAALMGLAGGLAAALSRRPTAGWLAAIAVPAVTLGLIALLRAGFAARFTSFFPADYAAAPGISAGTVFWLFLPPLIQQILMTDPGNHALTILALAAAVVGAAAAVGAVYAVVAHLWGRPPAPSPRLVLSKTCVVTALAALFLCALFLRLPDAAKRDAAHPDVILVSLDTLRADSVGCYGATPSPTPSVDALAQQATRYARTYAPSPWTIPSHAGLLTGLANERHGATRMDSRLPKRLTTLAEWFAQAGYRTAGFVNSFLLSPRYGFGQGFRTYDMLPERPGQHVMDRAVAWLDRQAGAPVFLFVHLFDAHWPYGAPDDALPGGHAKSFHEFVDQALPLDEPARSRWRARYADDVRLADASLGALVQHLRASRRYDDAWVIVTSDHGEEFWEHGFLGHAVTLYDEVLRVPLVVKAPRQADAAVVDQSVSLLDAPATLLAQALRRQPNDMDGKPLPPATGAPHDIAASSHLWGGPRFALIRGCVKGITAYTWRFGAYGGAVPPQAFDVCADPTESVNRHGADEARTLETDLARQSGIVPPGNAEAATLSEAERARLKALGYIP